MADVGKMPPRIRSGLIGNSLDMTDEYAGAAEFYDYVVPYATREDVQFFVDEARVAYGTT